MRIGIYGGSFDPIHVAHLLLAETALEQLSLDSIHFIPAQQSPLKSECVANAADRNEMLQLATCGNPKFIVDDRELRREGKSYTVDTLREVQRDFPKAQLYLLMGADSLNDFERWNRPEEICQIAHLAVAYRAGQSLPDFSIIEKLADASKMAQSIEDAIQMPQLEISSSDLRDRIAKNRSIRYRVPAAVAAYIQTKKLYQVNPC